MPGFGLQGFILLLLKCYLAVAIFSWKILKKFTGSGLKSVLLILSYFIVNSFIFPDLKSANAPAFDLVKDHLLVLGLTKDYATPLTYWFFISMVFCAIRSPYFWLAFIASGVMVSKDPNFNPVAYLGLPPIKGLRVQDALFFYLLGVGSLIYLLLNSHHKRISKAFRGTLSAFFRNTARLFMGELRLSEIFSKNKTRLAFKRRLGGIYNTYKSNPSKAGYAYETFIRDTLREAKIKAELATDMKKAGNYPKDLLRGGGDGGFDVIAEDNKAVYLIQTKFKGGRNKVKGEDIAKTDVASKIFKKYFVSVGVSKPIISVVMTNGDLDNTAKAYAKELNVSIWGDPHLDHLMAQFA